MLFYLCEVPTVMEVIEKENRMERGGERHCQASEEKQKVVFKGDGVPVW